ncbi:MAG TPA: TetR family transcriptional regulator [Burkholderiales bacterium]|nr:TetR family transcriptional regulator [Burkholderiales bacterium]
MARRTRKAALETRSRILDAAERVFSRRGVSRTSLDDIARAAGVTRGAIYWHFKDKADLFGAMLGRVALPMEEMLQRTSEAAGDDPLAHVRGRSVAVLRKVAGDARARRVFDVVAHKCEYVDEMAAVGRRINSMRANCLAQLESGFRNAIRRGLLPASVEPRAAAVGLHALVDGLITNWLVDPKYFADARAAERIVDRYLEGLGVRTQPVARKGRIASGTRAARARPTSA